LVSFGFLKEYSISGKKLEVKTIKNVLYIRCNNFQCTTHKGFVSLGSRGKANGHLQSKKKRK